MYSRTRISLLLTLLLTYSGLAAESQFERECASERTALTCVNGSTSEASCGGTDMDVYLRGDEVRKLDWWVEKSNQWVREQYFFRDSVPVFVIETVEAKYDSHAEPLLKPRLVSTKRYRLDGATQSKRRKEFVEHAEFLLRDFREHRSDFTPCVRPHT
jgi:hypothetical protein